MDKDFTKIEEGNSIRIINNYEDELGYFISEHKVLSIQDGKATLTCTEEGKVTYDLEWMENHVTNKKTGHYGISHIS